MFQRCKLEDSSCGLTAGSISHESRTGKKRSTSEIIYTQVLTERSVGSAKEIPAVNKFGERPASAQKRGRLLWWPRRPFAENLLSKKQGPEYGITKKANIQTSVSLCPHPSYLSFSHAYSQFRTYRVIKMRGVYFGSEWVTVSSFLHYGISFITAI